MTRRTRRTILIVLAVLLLAPALLLGSTAVAVWLSAHHDDASTVDATDLVLVLGAAQYQGEPSPVFIGRLDHAKLLWDDDRADRIVVLGAGQPGDTSTEAEAGREYLIDQGIPRWAVDAVPEGSTTLESLQAASDYMQEGGWDTAFLVSDPWHNLRLKRMAEDVGIRGYASATWQSAATSPETRSEGYLREIFAYLYYRAFGG